MKILITNDDGIDSDGLVRLANASKEFGEVYIVAPDGQRSAMSHSITLRHSIEAWQVDFPIKDVKAFACNGTPADCVRIGVLNIVPGRPDYVFSGINYGYNSASDLQYSATVGAALEASFQDVQAIAFSEDANDTHEVTDKYLNETIRTLIEKPLGKNQIWNVNFPSCKEQECKGIKWDVTVSDDEFYKDYYDEKVIGDNRKSYMVVGVRNWQAKEGTDLRAILDNYVSVGIVSNLK